MRFLKDFSDFIGVYEILVLVNSPYVTSMGFLRSLKAATCYLNDKHSFLKGGDLTDDDQDCGSFSHLAQLPRRGSLPQSQPSFGSDGLITCDKFSSKCYFDCFVI